MHTANTPLIYSSTVTQYCTADLLPECHNQHRGHSKLCNPGIREWMLADQTAEPAIVAAADSWQYATHKDEANMLCTAVT